MSSPPPLPNDCRPPYRFPITTVLLNLLLLLCGLVSGATLVWAIFVLPTRSELQRTKADFGQCVLTLSTSRFQYAACLDELTDCSVHLEALTSTSATVISYGTETQ